MGLASLILGIVSIIISFIPFIWFFSIFTAIVGFVLGIIALVKKIDKVKSIVGIVLSVITILLLMFSLQNISNIFHNITTSTSNNTTNTATQKITTTEDLKQNIVIEALGLTKNGDFAFKIKNNNNQAVFIDTVNTIFKDSNGNFMEKVQSQSQFFGIAANSEIINYAWGYHKDFSSYSNYEFEFELSSSWIAEDMKVDNFEITSNNTGKQIAVQVKNNNDMAFGSINVLVAFYQNDNLVGCEIGSASDTTTYANETAYINVSYPEDSNSDTITFDDYTVYLLEATKSY